MMPAIGLKYKASENLYPFFETGLVSLMDGPPVGFPEVTTSPDMCLLMWGPSMRLRNNSYRT